MHTNDTPTHSAPKIDRIIALPFRVSLDITIKNLKVRFFRSLITVAGLVLALAFLSFTLIGADIATGYLRYGGSEALDVLSRAGFTVEDAAGNPLGSIGTGSKERWIVILSLLVCTVGIVNSQLMSVTERFREIGVMKCLGALDSIILRLFLLEAIIMGMAGALAGIVLGFIIAILQSLILFGTGALWTLPIMDIGLSIIYSIIAGCGLSVIGVLYPALLAARMRPVQALKAQH